MIGSSISVVRPRVCIACRRCRGAGTPVAVDRRQQARQRLQRRQIYLCPLRPANRRACRPIEHPHGHIECRASRRTRQSAAGDSHPLPGNLALNDHIAPSPGMKLVENLGLAGFLGVRQSSCTTWCDALRSGRTPLWRGPTAFASGPTGRLLDGRVPWAVNGRGRMRRTGMDGGIGIGGGDGAGIVERAGPEGPTRCGGGERVPTARLAPRCAGSPSPAPPARGGAVPEPAALPSCGRSPAGRVRPLRI